MCQCFVGVNELGPFCSECYVMIGIEKWFYELRSVVISLMGLCCIIFYLHGSSLSSLLVLISKSVSLLFLILGDKAKVHGFDFADWLFILHFPWTQVASQEICAFLWWIHWVVNLICMPLVSWYAWCIVSCTYSSKNPKYSGS